jgi:hypothetical protein
MMNIGEFHCACRFYRAEEFGKARLLATCGYHANLERWSRDVRITIRGIDGQAERATKQEGSDEIIVGYKLNTGLWHRLLGLLSQCPSQECTNDIHGSSK